MESKRFISIDKPAGSGGTAGQGLAPLVRQNSATGGDAPDILTLDAELIGARYGSWRTIGDVAAKIVPGLMECWEEISAHRSALPPGVRDGVLVGAGAAKSESAEGGGNQEPTRSYQPSGVDGIIHGPAQKHAGCEQKEFVSAAHGSAHHPDDDVPHRADDHPGADGDRDEEASGGR